jgi:hypothetical protein
MSGSDTRRLRALRQEIDHVLAQGPRKAETTDEEDLTDRFYRALHSRRTPPGGRDSVHREQFARMLADVRARLADVTVPHPHWTRMGSDVENLVVRHRDGSEVLLPPAVAETWAEAEAELRAPAVAVTADARWLRWNPPGLVADSLRARLYLNVRPDRATEAWCRLVRALTDSTTAFTSKIAGSRDLLHRADCVVVYLAPDDLAAALAAMETAEVTRELAPQTPGFSVTVASGVGAAIVPAPQPAHTSVGLYWSQKLAQGWLHRRSPGLDAVCRAVSASWTDVLQHIR